MADNSFARLVAVLISPSKTFQSIAERPTWLVPMLVLVVLGALVMLIATPKIDWEGTLQARQVRTGLEISPERADLAIERMEQLGPVMILVTLVLPWIAYPLVARVFLGLFRRVGGELSFRVSLAVVLHGSMPWAVSSLFSIPVVLARDSLIASDSGVLMSSLAALAGDEVGLELFTLLASVDLFSLWTIALLVIGYRTAAKVPTSRAAACVVGLWVVWVAGKVGLVALDQLLERLGG